MIVVATWLVRCVAIAALLGVGALAWEAAARWSGRSARWGWLSALAGSIALPFVLWLMPERVQLPVPVNVLVFDPVAISAPIVAAQRAPLLSVGDAGALLWVVLSAAMLGYVGLVMVRLRTARMRWRQQEVDGAHVWVTRNVGPAALGVRRGMVVVPSWALELQDDLRALLLLHEREHVRAADPRLLFVALLLVATMPWNPLLWMMLLRLRNAIELDCDARVLASGANPQRYGSLLLEVGRRRSGSALMMATFAEPRMFLENRIRRIAQWPQQRRHGRAAVFAALALVLFTTALTARVRVDHSATGGLPAVSMNVEMPLMAVDTPPKIISVQGVPQSPMSVAELAKKPVFTPMTVRPELLNADEVKNALIESYPSTLRDAGIAGTPVVWFLIDATGTVVKTQLSKSSGFPALDEAGLNVASVMRFSPAMNREQKVAVWVEIPMVYRPANATIEQRVRLDEMGRRSEGAVPAVVLQEKVAGTARPALLNADEVAAALERTYPPLLKDAGVGGVTVVWFFVDVDGLVKKTQVSKSSGHAALDQAAIRVAQVLRFSPAMKDGVAVATWVEMPMVFGDVEVPTRAATTAPTLETAPDPNNSVSPVAPVRAGRQATQPPVVVQGQKVAPPQVGVRITEADFSGRARTQSPAITEKPVFTPMTVRPELLNSEEAARALVRGYPPLLRDAGIGGTPVVWFFINEEGTVVKTQLSRSSGYPALDEAALAVAKTMKFSPAMNRDQKVAVWIEIPIVYRVN